MNYNSLKKLLCALVLLAISPCMISSCAAPGLEEVEKWGIHEVALEGPSKGNLYMENSFEATFTNGMQSVTVPGFYDGNGNYKIRFSPNETGEWTYATRSNLTDLDGITGVFMCTEPGADNHGPLRIVNSFYLEYADGSPFYSVGTTAYQWTSVKQRIQEQTIKTLTESPFNKVRMCVFPKDYVYGNTTEPWALPFQKIDSINDLSQPNFEFFRNFDSRVAQLNNLNIQADIILFHPYDRWGYSQMGKEMNEKYVRYMIARLSAYRNVWWSLANEWDVPGIKEDIDWEGIGLLLQKEDPHQRLRGIHNWYHDESHFYDHSRPWVTHVSTQTYFFFNSIKWREKYQKPLLFDEMRYEGDVPSGWGNLTAEEMTSYFWKAGLSGGYGTHGETFKNDSDDETEVRWWAKGGTIMGNSTERIRFFRQILEEAPVREMVPEQVSLSGIMVPDSIPDDMDGSLIARLNNNIYKFYQEGVYYLAYTTEPGQTIELDLGGTTNFTLEVIDTWNMDIVSEQVVRPGKFEYKTKMPFTALRLIAK